MNAQNSSGSDPLYVIDGYGLIFRAYYAFMRTPIKTRDGVNASAVFGFFRVLLSLVKTYKPHYLAVALDSRTATFRDEIYAQYKANRQETPDDLKAQFPWVEEIMVALGLPLLRVNGFEADDLMATLARVCTEQQRPCVIVSADKDMLQLVRDGVSILRPSREGGFSEVGRQEVFEDKGVWPEQILDYLSLLGDASDNVPGVSGVGEKTAAKLLADFMTMDKIYQNLEQVQAKGVREKLAAGREAAILSRSLVTLRDDVPMPMACRDQEAANGIDWQCFHVASFNGMAAAQLLRKFDINQLASEMAAFWKTDSATNAAPRLDDSNDSAGSIAQSTKQSNTIEHSGPASYDPSQHSFVLVTREDEIKRWVSQAREAGVCCIDTETQGLDVHNDALCGISLCFAVGLAAYIPVRGPDGLVMPEKSYRELLRPLLEDRMMRFVGQNLKFDWQVLTAFGFKLPEPWFDTMIAAWLLDTNEGLYGMDHLAQKYLGYTAISFASLFADLPAKEAVTSEDFAFDSAPSKAASKKAPPRFSTLPLDKAAVYAAEDAEVTLRLQQALAPLLAKQKLEKLFFGTEMPLVSILAAMEWRGILLEGQRLRQYSLELDIRIRETEQEIHRLVGHPFNIASTKQLQQVLFVERKLTGSKRTKTGFSTDTSVLEELAAEDPVPAKILDYRSLTKLKSTYVDSLPLLINSQTQRLHTHFMQTGTATGRLSSKDPNLQNIPIKDEDGRRIRSAFVPAAGMCFVSADYSQIELVVLAHYARDPGLIAAFTGGVDVHTATAALIFGVNASEVDPAQRRAAKTINFGVMYGMSAFRLSRELGIPNRQAQAFIDAYFQTYSGIKEFIKKTVTAAETSGGVSTLLGRFRTVAGINSRNRNEKQAAERIAVNTPIQGTAADIVKTAMIRVDKALAKAGLKAQLILQVHDELILEVPLEEKDAVTVLLQEAMTGAITLDVPLKVSIESGMSWGAMH